jgi:hypothetical protein
MRVSTEVVRKVYNDEDGVYLEVGPSPDNPSWVRIYANEKNQDWFGKIDVVMPAEFAAQLGEALIAAAKEAQNAEA